MFPFENPILEQLTERHRHWVKTIWKTPCENFIAIVGTEFVLSSIFFTYPVFLSDLVSVEFYTLEVGLWTMVLHEALRKITYGWGHLLLADLTHRSMFKLYIGIFSILVFCMSLVASYDGGQVTHLLTYGALTGMFRGFATACLQVLVGEILILSPDEYLFLVHLGTSLSSLMIPIAAYLSYIYGPTKAQFILSPILLHTLVFICMIQDKMKKRRQAKKRMMPAKNEAQGDLTQIFRNTTPDIMDNSVIKRTNNFRIRRQQYWNQLQSFEEADPEERIIASCHLGMKPTEKRTQPNNTHDSSSDEESGTRNLEVVVQIENHADISASVDDLSPLNSKMKAMSELSLPACKEIRSKSSRSCGDYPCDTLSMSEDEGELLNTTNTLTGIQDETFIIHRAESLSPDPVNKSAVSNTRLANKEPEHSGLDEIQVLPSSQENLGQPPLVWTSQKMNEEQTLQMVQHVSCEFHKQASNGNHFIPPILTNQTLQYNRHNDMTELSNVHDNLRQPQPVCLSQEMHGKQTIGTVVESFFKNYKQSLDNGLIAPNLVQPVFNVHPCQRQHCLCPCHSCVCECHTLQAKTNPNELTKPQQTQQTGDVVNNNALSADSEWEWQRGTKRFAVFQKYCCTPMRGCLDLYFWPPLISKIIYSLSMIIIITSIPCGIFNGNYRNHDLISTFATTYNLVLLGLVWTTTVCIQAKLPQLSPWRRRVLYHWAIAMAAIVFYFLRWYLLDYLVAISFCATLGMVLGVTGLNEKAVMDHFKKTKEPRRCISSRTGVNNIYIEYFSGFLIIPIYYELYDIIGRYKLDVSIILRYSFVPFVCLVCLWVFAYLCKLCVEGYDSMCSGVAVVEEQLLKAYQAKAEREQIRTTLQKLRAERQL